MDRSVDIHDAVIYGFSVIGVTDTQPEMFIVLKSTLLTIVACEERLQGWRANAGSSSRRAQPFLPHQPCDVT